MKTLNELKDNLEINISGSDEVFIVPHLDPDFDAIGSAVGMSEICSKLKKDSYVIIGEDIQTLQPGMKKIIDETKNRYQYINVEDFNKIKNRDSNKLLITVDVNKSCRVAVSKDLDYFKNIIIIDHHKCNEETINTPNIYIDMLISSTSDIIYNLIKAFDVKVDSYLAAYLLSGIMVDTAKYTRNASDKTLLAASKLTRTMCQKLPRDYANNLFMDDFESDIKVHDLIRNTIFKTIRIAIALNREEPTKIYTKEDLAKTADYLLRYGVGASFALGYVDKETISISARSSGGLDSADVGEIMLQFGGGGNGMSAAAKINCDGKTIFDIEDELQKTLKLGNCPMLSK